MDIIQLRNYLKTCPDGPEKNEILDFLDALEKHKADYEKRFDFAMKGVV